MQNNRVEVHTDGGSRGNPGNAACAFVAEKQNIELFKLSKYLGKTTNNVAEYSATILALEWLLQNNYADEEIVFYSDSELMVKQINGQYKVRDEKILTLYSKVFKLFKMFNKQPKFIHVRRGMNKIADQLVNDELDANS
ncbi:MAG: ribonuclease HI family protein [Bacteroidales bacterium]|nr:ribonuclease HI family protein [Bacteroidales bacterium]